MSFDWWSLSKDRDCLFLSDLWCTGVHSGAQALVWRVWLGRSWNSKEAPLSLAAQSHLEGQLVCVTSVLINVLLDVLLAVSFHEVPAASELPAFRPHLIRTDACMTLKIQTESSPLSSDRYLVLKWHSAEAVGGHIANSLFSSAT